MKFEKVLLLFSSPAWELQVKLKLKIPLLELLNKIQKSVNCYYENKYHFKK